MGIGLVVCGGWVAYRLYLWRQLVEELTYHVVLLNDELQALDEDLRGGR